MEVSDEQLMLRYQNGDAAAFEILYRRHKGGVYRYLLRQIKNAATAEELFQEIWMNIIRYRSSYTDSAKFTTFIYRVAHNRMIDHYRKHAKVITLSFEDEGTPLLEEIADNPVEQPLSQLTRAEQIKQLATAIDELPLPQREVFLLHEEGALTLEQIAEATGVNRETAKSRLRYALAKLREKLRGHNE